MFSNEESARKILRSFPRRRIEGEEPDPSTRRAALLAFGRGMKYALEEAERRKDALPFLELLSAWTLVLGMGDAFLRNPRPEVSGRMDAGMARWAMEAVSIAQKAKAKFLPHISHPSMWTGPAPPPADEPVATERVEFLDRSLPLNYLGEEKVTDVIAGLKSIPPLRGLRAEFEELLDCIFAAQLPWAVDPEDYPPDIELSLTARSRRNLSYHKMNAELLVYCGDLHLHLEENPTERSLITSLASTYARFYYRRGPEQSTLLDEWLGGRDPYAKTEDGRRFERSWIHVPYASVQGIGVSDARRTGDRVWTAAIEWIVRTTHFHTAYRFRLLQLERFLTVTEEIETQQEGGKKKMVKIQRDRFFLPFMDIRREMRKALELTKVSLPTLEGIISLEVPVPFRDRDQTDSVLSVYKGFRLDQEPRKDQPVPDEWERQIFAWVVTLWKAVALLLERKDVLPLNSVVMKAMGAVNFKESFQRADLQKVDVFEKELVSDVLKGKLTFSLAGNVVREVETALAKMDSLNAMLLLSGLLVPAGSEAYERPKDPVERWEDDRKEWLLSWKDVDFEKEDSVSASIDAMTYRKDGSFDLFENGILRDIHAYQPDPNLPRWTEGLRPPIQDADSRGVVELANALVERERSSKRMDPNTGYTVHLFGKSDDKDTAELRRVLTRNMTTPGGEPKRERHVALIYLGETPTEYAVYVLGSQSFFALGRYIEGGFIGTENRTTQRTKARESLARVSTELEFRELQFPMALRWLNDRKNETRLRPDGETKERGAGANVRFGRTYVYALWSFLNAIRGMEEGDFRTVHRLFPTIQDYVERQFYSEIKGAAENVREGKTPSLSEGAKRLIPEKMPSNKNVRT